MRVSVVRLSFSPPLHPHLHFDVIVLVGSTDTPTSLTVAFIVVAPSENLPPTVASMASHARRRRKIAQEGRNRKGRVSATVASGNQARAGAREGEPPIFNTPSPPLPSLR